MSSNSSRILRASFWLLIASWYSRILAMFSVIILARNLDKHDFGILAACFIVQNFFKVISNVGSNQFLIRKEHITENDINGAWTINLLSKSLVFFLIFFSSDFVAEYMNIVEIAFALKVMAISAVFIGLKNPAISINIKALDYSKLSMLEVITKSISSTLSISIAIIYQSYWAVVIGDITYNLIYAIGSHWIVKSKLKFTFSNIYEQWVFSKWVLLKGIVNYIKVAFDKIVVSKSYSVESLGLYNFSQQSAATAKDFFITPLNGVIYPSLSTYINDNSELLDKIYKSILVLAIIYMPIVFGGVYLSETIVPLVFGNQWIEAIPLFSKFLCMTFAGLLVSVFTDIFTLTGRVKVQFYYELITSIIFLLIMLPASYLTLDQFTLCRAIIPYVMLFAMLLVLKNLIKISIFRILLLFFPIALSSTVMVISLDMFSSYFKISNNIINLLISIAIGAVIYLIILISLIYLLKGKFREYEFIYKTFIIQIVERINHVKIR